MRSNAVSGNTSVSSEIYFNVLSLDIQSGNDDLDWSGFQRLIFPKTVRPVGMNIINVPGTYNTNEGISELQDALEPFRVITNQEYIYLLRQSKKGTLLVNRFRLVRNNVSGDPQKVVYSLAPAWEVRYQRSGKPDTPADEKDVQDYLSPDDEPFIEPTLELFMVNSLAHGNFDAKFLSKDNGALLVCQIFVVDEKNSQIQGYSIPLDKSGQFDLTKKTFKLVERKYLISADFTFSLTDEKDKLLKLSGAPSATFYFKQERTVDSKNGAIMVKRSGRVMLAVTVQLENGQKTIATVDFAAANDGTVALPASKLVAGPIGVANFALEFDNNSYLRFKDITFTEQFGLDFWIYPQSQAQPKYFIIGNAQNEKAPYVKLSEGTRIETGFTGKNGKILVCQTQGVIRQEAWNHVQISFNQAASPKFVILINDAQVLTTISGEGDIPDGTPINCISAKATGFVGDIDAVKIYNSASFNPQQLLSEWPSDTIIYNDEHGNPLDPPLTPNTKDPNNPGQVYGAYLVPSTSPTSTGNAGTLSWDARGLSISTAYFSNMKDFSEIKSSPVLFDGSDGLIHCYFQGEDDLFSVMQYDVQSARAVFMAEWKTSTGNVETGAVQLIAGQSGAFMNDATIKVLDAGDETLSTFFCNLDITSPSGREEHWRGVPRSLQAFAGILNGDIIVDPSDMRLLNGQKIYFDPSGTRAAAYLPVNNNPAAAMLAFVTRYQKQFPLASVQITNVTNDTADLIIKLSTPRWNGVELQQNWNGVPSTINYLIDTLNGMSTTYNYKNPSYSNIKTYSITAVSEVVSANQVIFFVHPDTTQVSKLIVENGIKQDVCNVTLSVKKGSGPLTATWKDVPRLQMLFAQTLENSNPDYDYVIKAIGDYQAVGQLLIITTNGVNANVANVTKPITVHVVEPDNDMLVGAGLFDQFTTAPVQSNEKVAVTSPMTASAFQKAYYKDQMEGILERGSTLFRAIPATQPIQGSVGLVQNTANLTNGVANLIQLGINGGWMNEPTRRMLSFAWNNWVSFETDETKAPNISALTIPGDLSLEIWCKPTRSNSDSMFPNQRLLTFSRTQQLPDDTTYQVRYMAGLQDCRSLSCKNDTNIRAAYDTLNATFYTWFCAETAESGKKLSGIIGSIATRLVTDPIFEIKVNENQKIEVDFNLTKGQKPIVSDITVQAEEWYQVAVTFTSTSTKSGQNITYQFKIALFVNGMQQGESATYEITVPNTAPINTATMVIGDITNKSLTLPMSVNEAAFFDDVLNAELIDRYFEQRLPDNLANMVLKWMFIEGDGNTAVNTAPTGTDFDVDIRPSANWNYYGLYFRPILGYEDNICILDDQPIIHGWNHLSMVHQAGYALHLNGAQYADCGNDASLNLDGKFAIESWVMLDEGGESSETLLAKGSSYQLWIPYNKRPRFEMTVVINEVEEVIAIESSVALTCGEAYYLAINYELKTVELIDGDKRTPKYELHLNMYLNNKLVASGVKDSKNPSKYKLYADPANLVSSTANLNLGRTPENNGSRYLKGFLAEVRIWNRTLSELEIRQVYLNHCVPSNVDGLISYWRFNEITGKIAYDARGNNNARLSDSGLMVYFKPTSANRYYLNAQESTGFRHADNINSVGGYGEDNQFYLGYVKADDCLGFYGGLDDVRIWNIQLTQEQIADSMNRALTGGEDHLAGYWNFNIGSGMVVSDLTGRENDGIRGASDEKLPIWETSQAPISNEANAVYNILGGVHDFALRKISEAPAVVEYADVQRDAYGTLFSAMKRAYVFISNGKIDFITRYKTGDLDTIYLGQAQSKPSLIGFIEGAPPVPSENQTMPYWKGDPTTLNTYAGITSVQFQEAYNTIYTFNADRDTSSTNTLSMKGGFYLGGQYSASAGIGFEVENPALVFEGHAGAQNHIEIASHTKTGSNTQFGTGKTLTSVVKPGGYWEPGNEAKSWVNPTVGRRYLPSNTGFALVKSLAVDVYASILKSTGAMVKMTMIPNSNIPPDVNIIDFPMNARYVKNGTLDGKVGLKNDPSYPNADYRRGSYFKPLEAYALKRSIEREEKQLEAYYQQYDASRYSSKLRNESNWDDYKVNLRNTSAYDWAKHLAKRNIINTYVWTAGGGTFAEQTSPMNVYSESYGAVSTGSFGLGAVGDLQMAGPVAGFYVDIDYLYSYGVEINIVKSKEEGASFNLNATTAPDWFLCAPRFEPDGTVTLTEGPVEGKVDDYRYSAFFLAPTMENFDMFFHTIVDPDWFRNSMQSNAVALREAVAAENGVWRILYRVTYVSRIPPQFQPVPSETKIAEIKPPANIEYNTLMVQLVEQQLHDIQHPTPLQIGAAIMSVLGTPDNPGLLQDILPWWNTFLQDSKNYKLPAAGILRALREDLLNYMIQATQEE